MIVVGSIVLVSIIVFIGLINVLVKNYIRIAPNKAAVLYGRKNVNFIFNIGLKLNFNNK